ncbi:MAG TPA: NAD(P)-dependent oxidoreductase [Rectinemataceae bacterium]|nr:NAD(P)-dependent oxidoreductase [Rectinemataceae bacterium]
MRVLVSGAFGNVGRSTLAALAERSAEVTVLEADTRRNRHLAPRLARELGRRGQAAFSSLILGDVREPDITAKAVAGQDAIIHLAALIPPAADRQPELARSINVGGTAALIEAAKAFGAGAPRFILASSIAAYGDRLQNFWISATDPLAPSPGDAYGSSKVEAESLVRKSGLPFCILRLTYIVWRKKLARDPLMFHMPLATRIEICHTEDTGRAFASAAHNPAALGRTFDIGGGETCRTSYRDYLDAMFRLFGLGGFGRVPEAAFAPSGFHCGWYADSDEADRVLGFRHKTLADYYVEVAEEAGWKRIAAAVFRPFIRAGIAAKSPFLKKGAGQA